MRQRVSSSRATSSSRDVRTHLRTVELRVRNLGFPQGATISDVYTSAKHLGLRLCPVELGPHLRLQFLDQPKGLLGQPVRAASGTSWVNHYRLGDTLGG